MIQEIFPHVLHNEFKIKSPGDDSFFFCFSQGKLLLHSSASLTIPAFKDLEGSGETALCCCDYLFSIDERDYYLIDEKEVMIPESHVLKYYDTKAIRDLEPLWVSFAAASAAQLNRFYHNNRFCGCCGEPMRKSRKERSLVCSSCQNTVYPKIAPAVIVAITHEGRLLLTKYAGREYTRYALVAGYTEFGETLEETVKREVMEEVGLKVKNIRYYKNQPWPFSDSLLVGFWAELDGSPQISLDQTELSSAVWVKPEEISDDYTNVSLTHEMILLFKNNKVIS